MKKFLVGLVLGLFLASCYYYFYHPDPLFRLKVGRLLDRDTVYLEDGTIVHGWIVKSDENYIWIETESGYFDLPVSRCKIVRKNTLLRYIREFQ